MSNEIEEYKRFIDGILATMNQSLNYKKTVFIENRWNQEFAKHLNSLDPETRSYVISLMTDIAEGITHDLLVFLNDQDYQIRKGTITLAKRPFDYSLYEDFTSRLLKYPWADEDEG